MMYTDLRDTKPQQGGLKLRFRGGQRDNGGVRFEGYQAAVGSVEVPGGHFAAEKTAGNQMMVFKRFGRGRNAIFSRHTGREITDESTIRPPRMARS